MIIFVENLMVTVLPSPRIPLCDVDGFALSLPDRLEVKPSLMMRPDIVLNNALILGEAVPFPCGEV